MFDDLTDAELVTMRTDLRAAVIALNTGSRTAEVRYGDSGRKFHPADPAGTQDLLNRVIAEINKRAGTTATGAIFPVAG